MEQAFAKGQTMKSLLLYMKEKLSPAQFNETLASIPPEERKQIEGAILATSTFPIALVNRLTIEGARVAGLPLAEFARGAGRFSAQEGVRGVYRMFVRVLTADALLAKAASMWSSMNNMGKMDAVRQSGGSSTLIRLTDYPSEAVMCLRIAGWIEQLAQMTGTKASVVHGRCAAKGDGVCEWMVRY